MSKVNIAKYVFIFFLILPLKAEAQSGCCSNHKGVCGAKCCDGSSKSAHCNGEGSPQRNSSQAASPPSKVQDVLVSRDSTLESSNPRPEPFQKQPVLQNQEESPQAPSESGLVCQVIAADVIELCTREKIKLIGVGPSGKLASEKLEGTAESPELDATISKFAQSALEFTTQLCDGKQVSIEFDVEKENSSGEMLGYVYLANGTFVNAEIIKQGFASPMMILPNVKYADSFQKLYQEARENKRGLWK